MPKDPKKAFEWLSKAAEANRPLAQHHLAVMIFTGEGTLQNPVKALMWLRLAILHYPDGPDKDRAKQDRDSIAAQLTRRDKERAVEMTRDWLAKKGERHLMNVEP